MGHLHPQSLPEQGTKVWEMGWWSIVTWQVYIAASTCRFWVSKGVDEPVQRTDQCKVRILWKDKVRVKGKGILAD